MQSLSLLITALTIACQMKNLMNNNETYYTYVPTLACEINVTHGSLLQ